MQFVPFNESEELYCDLKIENPSNVGDFTGIKRHGNLQCLPSQPTVRLNSLGMNTFLTQEFLRPDIERLASRLWMVSTRSPTNTWYLHQQQAHGRHIVVNEDFQWHLCWIRDKIFIKPIPVYLLSHAFWTSYLINSMSPLSTQREPILRAISGFLRSYYHLIKYDVDFELAQSDTYRLIPKGITWEQFASFIAHFGELEDSDVSLRYEYGELRLTRLNILAKVLLRKAHFFRSHADYSSYYTNTFGPMLLVLTVLSTILSAMQIIIESSNEHMSIATLYSLRRLCLWFAISCLLFLALLVLSVVFTLVPLLVHDVTFKTRTEKRKQM